MQLQDRDREILTLCYEQRFLLIRQIEKFFYKGSYEEAKRRVREMKKANLMRDAKNNLGRSKILELTKIGRAIAVEQSLIGSLPNHEIDPSAIEHHALVTETRLLLEKLWDGYWIPELALRAHFHQEIPDGIFVFHESGNKVMVELENSLKGRARFENRIRSWQHSSKTVFVLFVCTSAQIQTSLIRYLEKSPSHPLHLVTTLSELEQPEPVAWSIEGEVLPFSIRTY